MGTADAVPGVSGGTIALILGIYERLITAVTSITPQKLLLVLNVSDLSGAKEALEEIDAIFLTILGLGIVTAVVSVLRLVYFLISSYPVSTFGFFFGLIAVSALLMYRQIDLSGWRRKTVALTGFGIAFTTSGFAASSLGHSSPVIFVSGMVAVTAMVLPGLSGSLLLMVLGQYEYMSGALTRFTDSLVYAVSGDFEPLIESSPSILVFITGGTVGLLTVAHTVRKALTLYKEATYVFLVSLVFGALRAPVVEVEERISDQSLSWIQVFPEFLAAAALGAFAIYLLDLKSDTVDYL